MKKVALIDYGSGNLHSVNKALLHVGADVTMVSAPEGLEGMDAVLLPGVGAFGDCVSGIRSRGLWDALHGWMQADKPFLGICVGYQLLFDSSEESPDAAGFGFFAGKVKHFAGNGLKVPQIGWNALSLAGEHTLWRGLPSPPFVYFVHSYFPEPNDPGVVLARAEYGETFAAGAGLGRISAVQFHPEKSQATGLAMLKNWVESI